MGDRKTVPQIPQQQQEEEEQHFPLPDLSAAPKKRDVGVSPKPKIVACLPPIEDFFCLPPFQRHWSLYLLLSNCILWFSLKKWLVFLPRGMEAASVEFSLLDKKIRQNCAWILCLTITSLGSQESAVRSLLGGISLLFRRKFLRGRETMPSKKNFHKPFFVLRMGKGGYVGDGS